MRRIILTATLSWACFAFPAPASVQTSQQAQQPDQTQPAKTPQQQASEKAQPAITPAQTTLQPAPKPDTVRTIAEVSVSAVRAGATTPMAYANVHREQIEHNNFGQDVPFLLLNTPSAVATSDAGNGVGYTGIRIRGSDASRINVTLNDIPLNDAESHGLYWVDLPDVASSLEDMQIQRGVGSSTNGAGAFGGSINMRSAATDRKAGGELSGSYGSFNTYRRSIKLTSGLVDDRWGVSLRLSDIHSDGYIRRASTDMSSYFAQLEYLGNNWFVKLIGFSGREKSYHAWDGVSRSQLLTDRRYNPSGEIRDANNNVTGFYDGQTDNYLQNNYQLLFTRQLGKKWSFSHNFHYTRGDGYYEEYKNDRKLVEYGLRQFTDGSGTTISKSSLVRRKQMGNDFWGVVVTLDYTADKLHVTQGTAVNHYVGGHKGRVIWVKNYIGDLAPDHVYYRNSSDKDDVSLFLKATYALTPRLSLYGDAQYRYIYHRIDGVNDKWDGNAMQPLDVSRRYDFFNPKGGLFWRPADGHELFASVAVGHKEPTRNNFTDAVTSVPPRAESVVDYEVGYNYKSAKFSASANLYYMDYRDQIILTGRVNEIGEPIGENVPVSYRMGVELTAGARIVRRLRWDGNISLSRNRIENYVEYVDDWVNGGQQTLPAGNTTIAYSPSVTAASVFSFDLGALNIALQSNFVGAQYLSNSNRDDLRLKSYLVNNLRASYLFRLGKTRGLELSAALNNLLDHKYESNGWGYSYLDDDNGAVRRIDDAGYFPQAGINFMTAIKLRF
ncbi:MAG: TonB-dependent receptor [Rikenellaceae bacterium]|nr:TonB-dependent receptor [Rikenellaceae bacterium]